MEKNKSLFWYGFWARIKQVLGGFIAFGSVVSYAVYVHAYPNYFILLTVLLVVGMISGGVLYLKARSQHFDFKKRSGYIVWSGRDV